MATIHFEIPDKYLDLACSHLVCRSNNQDVINKIQDATRRIKESDGPIILSAEDFEDDGQLFLGLSFGAIGKYIV